MYSGLPGRSAQVAGQDHCKPMAFLAFLLDLLLIKARRISVRRRSSENDFASGKCLTSISSY